ncbi:hypothetical protein V6Z12_D11G140200 [Gossypium hirsutum]
MQVLKNVRLNIWRLDFKAPKLCVGRDILTHFSLWNWSHDDLEIVDWCILISEAFCRNQYFYMVNSIIDEIKFKILC